MKRARGLSKRIGVVALVFLMLILGSESVTGQCTQWEVASELGPDARLGVALVYDSRREVVVLFGGRSQSCCPWIYYGDTWEWDGQAWMRMATEGPSPRLHAGMAYDSRRGVAVLFGGHTDNYNETWEWDGSTWRLVASDGPDSQDGLLAYDEARGETVFFGRSSESETWTWDGSTWELVALDGPSPRLSAAMAYDSARERVVLYGGRQERGFNDTWEWDGVSWSFVAQGGPSPRSGSSMAYDPMRGITLLMGGYAQGGPTHSDTWAWDGIGWTRLAEDFGADPGQFGEMAVDVARGGAIVYGGYLTGTRTLASSPELWFRRSPATVMREAGERAEFAAIADGVGELSYQWHFDGRRLSDFGPFTGARTSTLTVDPVLPETAGRYTLTVTASCGSITSAPAHLVIVDPRITVYNDCLANNQVAVVWEGTTPSGRVHLLHARQTGSWDIPARFPCAGTPLGLDRSSTTLVYSGASGFAGEGQLLRTVYPRSCVGYLQMIDEATCRTSNVAQID